MRFFTSRKTMAFHNVIKSVWNKDKNYYYNIFSEKAFYKLPNKFLYKIQMIYYDKIDVSEGIDVNKTSKSKECEFATISIF